MRDWPGASWRYSGGVCDPAHLNAFPPHKGGRHRDPTKRGRTAAHMVWRLEPDQALIVEMDNHDGFWIFGMGGVFGNSMDLPVPAGELHTLLEPPSTPMWSGWSLCHDDPVCTTGLTHRDFRMEI